MKIDHDYLRRALASADAARLADPMNTDGGYPYAYGALRTAVEMFLAVNDPPAEQERGGTEAA